MKLSHGVDLSLINRNEFNNLRLVRRILTNNEYHEFLNQVMNRDNQNAWLAAKWAIKEAYYKASNCTIPFNQIEIIHTNNKPFLKINNEVLQNVDVSISYEHEYVLASVIIYNE